jgi:hypothetical protein
MKMAAIPSNAEKAVGTQPKIRPPRIRVRRFRWNTDYLPGGTCYHRHINSTHWGPEHLLS